MNFSRIFATCPRTGERLDTGIQLSVDVFDRLTGIDAPVFCPHCKAIHRWTRQSSSLRHDASIEAVPTT